MIKRYFLEKYENNKEVIEVLELIPQEYFINMNLTTSKKSSLKNLIISNNKILVPYLYDNLYHIIENMIDDLYIFEYIKNKTYDMCLNIVKNNNRISL